IIQDDIENHLSSSGQSIYFNSSIAPVCGSPRVVSFLLGLYGQDGVDDYRRYLLGLRLQDCVRPRHLEGWESYQHDGRLSPALHREALTNSEQRGLYRGVPGDLKGAAWDLLLRLHDGHILSQADEALTHETSPSVRYDICETLACFRLP